MYICIYASFFFLSVTGTRIHLQEECRVVAVAQLAQLVVRVHVYCFVCSFV